MSALLHSLVLSLGAVTWCTLLFAAAADRVIDCVDCQSEFGAILFQLI